MNSQSNSFEDLISSFKIVCTALERKAENSLKQIEKECSEEFSASIKSLRKFNELVSGINETCSEIVNSHDILKSVTVINENENVINLPYDMHSDLVKCINELFNMIPMKRYTPEGKLIDEKNQLSVSQLLKVCEQNVHEVKDIEKTITEATETV